MYVTSFIDSSAQGAELENSFDSGGAIIPLPHTTETVGSMVNSNGMTKCTESIICHSVPPLCSRMAFASSGEKFVLYPAQNFGRTQLATHRQIMLSFVG